GGVDLVAQSGSRRAIQEPLHPEERLVADSHAAYAHAEDCTSDHPPIPSPTVRGAPTPVDRFRARPTRLVTSAAAVAVGIAPVASAAAGAGAGPGAAAGVVGLGLLAGGGRAAGRP